MLVIEPGAGKIDRAVVLLMTCAMPVCLLTTSLKLNVTAPQPEFLNGDFSRLLGPAIGQNDALGRPVLRGAIYDPLTFRQLDDGRWIGDMFPEPHASTSGRTRSPRGDQFNSRALQRRDQFHEGSDVGTDDDHRVRRGLEINLF